MQNKHLQVKHLTNYFYNFQESSSLIFFLVFYYDSLPQTVHLWALFFFHLAG
ncbi:MAG: hypothetical protein ACOVQA_12890 [Thermoflexibacteraceae bacterium]